MASPGKRSRTDTSSGTFSLAFAYDVSDLTPRPVSGTLSCPAKNWEWILHRRDVGIFQGLSQTLQKIPARLLEDAERLNSDGRPEFPKPNSSIDGVKDQLELWWKEAHRMEAAHQLGPVDGLLARPRTRAAYKKHLIFNTYFSGANVEVEGPTSVCSSTGSGSSISSSLGSLGECERSKSLENSKGLAEILGEFLSLLSEYQRIYATGSGRDRFKISEQVLDDAGWLAVGCALYLKYFTSIWIKTQSTSSMIAEVLESEHKAVVHLLEAEWKRFQIPRFQSLSTPPPSPPLQERRLDGECGRMN